MSEKIDYEKWMRQPLIWGERCRGRGLVWTAESNWFINDPLGHMPHSHDDASEIVFLAQGSMEILVGGTKRLYNAGDFIIMPPGKYHDYWFRGEDPVCLFVVVAPNHKYNRWRIKDFPPEAHEGDGIYANAFTSDTLPSDEFFTCEICTLHDGESDLVTHLDLQDRLIYVLNGQLYMYVGHLYGALVAHQYQYIPATYRHDMTNPNAEPVTYISITITDPFTAKGTRPED